MGLVKPMRDAPRHAALLLIAAVAYLSGACGSTTWHGDARLVDEGSVSFWPEAADYLEFPATPLKSSGVFRYRVSSLPQVIYPDGFHLDVPEEEDLGPNRQFAWSSCVIRASLLTPDGRPFYTRTIHLGRDRLGSSPGRRRHRQVFFAFTDDKGSGTTRLPRQLSYVLQIEVLQPSSRASDVLTTRVFTSLPSKVRP